MGTVSNPACLGIESSAQSVELTWRDGNCQAIIGPESLRRGRSLAEAVADVHG